MTDGAPIDPAVLSARLVALAAENARLREAVGAPDAGAARGGRWRAWTSALCIVVAAILLPVSIVTAWARVQLVDEESFVATLAPLASDVEIRSMIVDQTMDAITERADFAALSSSVVDGIAALGLPPAALSALRLLEQPAAEGLESLVERAVMRVVASDAFTEVWATSTRAAHRALTTAATSDGAGLVVRTDDGVGIQLGAVVERVRQSLTDQGVGAAVLIPTVDRVVIVGTGQSLALIRTGYAVTTAVGFWLPLVSLALLAAGVLLARRRATAVLGAGVGLLVGGGSLAVGISIGGVAIGSVAAQTDLPPSALAVIYRQVSDGMAHTAAMLAAIGLMVAAIAWANGRSRAAVALRGAIGSANSGLRRALRERGVDTGSFGRWMYAQRALVRGILTAVAILWLLAMRPLTLGDIVLVLAVTLVLWWLAELVQSRADEVPALEAGTGAPDTVASDAPVSDDPASDAAR